MKFKIKTKVVLENPHNAYNGLQFGQGYEKPSNVIKYDLFYLDGGGRSWVPLATFGNRQAAKDFALVYGKNDAEEEFEV